MAPAGEKHTTRRSVSVSTIVLRGVSNRCPNCGARSLFSGVLRASERCRDCSLLFEREEGFFLGAMVVNYTLSTLLGVVAPSALLLAGQLAPVQAFAVAIALCLTLPLLFYRASKSLWLMTYYAFVPGDLPANGGGEIEGAQRP